LIVFSVEPKVAGVRGEGCYMKRLEKSEQT